MTPIKLPPALAGGFWGFIRSIGFSQIIYPCTSQIPFQTKTLNGFNFIFRFIRIFSQSSLEKA